jgi:hypothetical protein
MLFSGVAARESMETRLYHAMHTVDAHLGVRLFIVVVAFVDVRSSVGHWRLHRSCNPIRGVSEPESRRDTGRRGAAGETATRGRNCACGTRHANFWPSPLAIVASMKRAAHQRPMPTRARLTVSARGDGLIPVQRTRRAEGGNQARPPVALRRARRARALAPERFPAFRAYLKPGEQVLR